MPPLSRPIACMPCNSRGENRHWSPPFSFSPFFFFFKFLADPAAHQPKSFHRIEDKNPRDDRSRARSTLKNLDFRVDRHRSAPRAVASKVLATLSYILERGCVRVGLKDAMKLYERTTWLNEIVRSTRFNFMSATRISLATL